MAGWCHHDFGHNSVFKGIKLNRLVQTFYISFIRGGCCDWWNAKHNSHHAKTNVNTQDPDVIADPLFVFGEDHAKKRAKFNAKNSKKKPVHYPYQQYIFVVFSALFHLRYLFVNVRHVVKKRKYLEMLLIALMFALFFSTTTPVFGLAGALLYWFVCRSLHSMWFIWVTQTNHIPMDIHAENRYESWLDLQLHGTLNIETSWFNDWFTGHLNFQIEHHLFPTMPRHNCYKIQPYVKSLCEKYDIPYVSKSFFQSFYDVIISLKEYGQIWDKAYLMEILDSM